LEEKQQNSSKKTQEEGLWFGHKGGPFLLFFNFIFLSPPPLEFGCGVPFRYFYVMCCECGDIDGYRCQHRNAQQLRVY